MTLDFVKHPSNLSPLLFAILFLGLQPLAAHSPKETHSQLYLETNQLVFRLELPWTILEAVKEAYPEISAKHSRTELIEYTEKYIGQYLILKQQGQSIPFERIKQEDDGHGHNAIFFLYYPIKELMGLEVENQLLFNINKHQKNYHQIAFSDGSKKSYKTSLDKAQFTIGLASDNPQPLPHISTLIALLGLLGIPLAVRSWQKETQDTINSIFR